MVLFLIMSNFSRNRLRSGIWVEQQAPFRCEGRHLKGSDYGSTPQKLGNSYVKQACMGKRRRRFRESDE